MCSSWYLQLIGFDSTSLTAWLFLIISSSHVQRSCVPRSETANKHPCTFPFTAFCGVLCDFDGLLTAQQSIYFNDLIVLGDSGDMCQSHTTLPVRCSNFHTGRKSSRACTVASESLMLWTPSLLWLHKCFADYTSSQWT